MKFQQTQGNSAGWYPLNAVLKDKEKAASIQQKAEVRKEKNHSVCPHPFKQVMNFKAN